MFHVDCPGLLGYEVVRICMVGKGSDGAGAGKKQVALYSTDVVVGNTPRLLTNPWVASDAPPARPEEAGSEPSRYHFGTSDGIVQVA